MPKHKIEGTHRAVKTPCSLNPENHRYPESAKEMATAVRMYLSDVRIIFLPRFGDGVIDVLSADRFPCHFFEPFSAVL